MTTPKTLILAVGRWLELLSRTTFVRANVIVHYHAAYTDITPTQYASALEWIRNVPHLNSLIAFSSERGMRKLPLDFSKRMALEALILEESPSWLQVVDELVVSQDDLPNDVVCWAECLDMTDAESMDVVRSVSGKVDAQARKNFGEAGESALVTMLEAAWPGSVTHVSMVSDSLGYDIAFRPGDVEWHLEVKSVASGVRRRIFLSRNDFEVSLRDRYWRLVLVVLDAERSAQSVSILESSALWTGSPRDVTSRASWETSKFILKSSEGRSTFCRALSLTPPQYAHAALYDASSQA